eukprot:scaffold451304_cov17-Prasinocladus_malaysianus.AAC.1
MLAWLVCLRLSSYPSGAGGSQHGPGGSSLRRALLRLRGGAQPIKQTDGDDDSDMKVGKGPY